jgi:hypothetical protein
MRGTTGVGGRVTTGGRHGSVEGVGEESESDIAGYAEGYGQSGVISGVVLALLCCLQLSVLIMKRCTSDSVGLATDINIIIC